MRCFVACLYASAAVLDPAHPCGNLLLQSMSQRPFLEDIVCQHAEESAHLSGVRSMLHCAPHIRLQQLSSIDERLAAHLDGLWTAWPASSALLDAALADSSAGATFAQTVMALQSRHAEHLSKQVAVAETLLEAERGLLSALGWVSAEGLQGTVRALLGSKTPIHRAWGLAACAMHRVDPGLILTQAVQDADPIVRTHAWRVAGQSGRRDLADAARLAISRQAAPVHDEHATVVVLQPTPASPTEAAPDLHAEKRAAAWALTLLGEGNNDLVWQALLTPQSDQALPCQDAHRLAAIAGPIDWGREQVRSLAAQAESSKPHKRRMLRLAAWVGDPQVIPWLIHHMADDVWARLAGEAFCMVTGADLDKLQLYRVQPEGVDFGPTEDPEDENVAMDEDDGLMWPDPMKVQDWWQANASRFTPGQRYFVGAAPSIRHCLHVLRHGYQRQRIMAAEYLCLLRPGSKLFPVAAPAWRQQRWLAEEEAALSAAHSAHAQASP